MQHAAPEPQPAGRRLVVEAVSVHFNSVKALDNVSLELCPGEILGLIGPNGSGKTTLINAITGQVPLVSGRVLFDGEDVTHLPPRQRALRGVLRSFQTVRLFRDLTVAENIEVAAVAKGASRRAAQKLAEPLLEEFNLAAKRNELAGSLSYGDERRVEIARALAADPRYLLLDEPAAGMNEEESEGLLHILKALPERRGLGIIIIDHDMPLIMRLCSRLQALASGRTIAVGTVDEVRNAPAVVEAYLGSSAAEVQGEQPHA